MVSSHPPPYTRASVAFNVTPRASHHQSILTLTFLLTAESYNLNGYYISDFGDFAPDQGLYSVDEVELAERASPACAKHFDADVSTSLVAFDDASIAAIRPECRSHLVEGSLDPPPHISRAIHAPIIQE